MAGGPNGRGLFQFGHPLETPSPLFRSERYGRPVSGCLRRRLTWRAALAASEKAFAAREADFKSALGLFSPATQRSEV